MSLIEHSEHDCGCGNVCKHPDCALYGAGGICGEHGSYDGLRCPNCQLRGAVAEADRLRAAISWARGMCTDRVPYQEIDAGLGRALDNPGGQ